jgi:hypothetical protein
MTKIIDTRKKFNALPVGTVLRDEDGWTHTKVADSVQKDGGEAHITTTYVDTTGLTGTFYQCWNHSPVVVSTSKKNVPNKTFLPGNIERIIQTIDPETVEVGDWIKIADDGRFGGFTSRSLVGEVVKVVNASNRYTGTNDKSIDFEHDGKIYTGYGYEWFVFADEPEVEPEASSRPLIDFSGSSRATARQYAKSNASRANEKRTNELLEAVAAAEQVDAYELNAALLDAMRRVGTRGGDRRQHGTELAHLGHIVQAVLENHADNLPAYAEGERSRKVETLEAEVEMLRQGVDLVRREKDDEIDKLRLDLLRESSKVNDARRIASARLESLDQALKSLDGVRTERDEIQAVLNYAFEQMSDTAKQRVLGFWDGVRGDAL